LRKSNGPNDDANEVALTKTLALLAATIKVNAVQQPKQKV